MRILFLISGREVPSSRYRILQYVPYLQQRGHHCVVLPSIPPKYRGWPWLGNRLSDLPRCFFRGIDLLRALIGRFDVVVIERELYSSGLLLYEKLFRRIAGKLVLDVDDGIFLQHPQKFRTLVAMCDHVVAGSGLIAEELRKYNPQVTVIPTSIDLANYPAVSEQSKPHDKFVIGWTGTAGNYPHLQSILPALRELRIDAELRIIAEREPPQDVFALKNINVRFQHWRAESEADDLRDCDVGIMPLPDDEWSRYKCGLKILQYMAAGIPAIASPVGVNGEIITDEENGLLANSPGEWTTALTRLAGDAELRERLVAAGRATVEERYSVERKVSVLEELLKRVIDQRD